MSKGKDLTSRKFAGGDAAPQPRRPATSSSPEGEKGICSASKLQRSGRLVLKPVPMISGASKAFSDGRPCRSGVLQGAARGRPPRLGAHQ
jgi:hypothetical protein